ncbi:MAG: DUF4426 domain-containing protein [Pontibacterium sp.]
MNIKAITTSLLAGFLSMAFAFSPLASAEQKVVYDHYEIHYNAFNSTFIAPEVARDNRLERGRRKALINVSVLEIQDDGSKKPVGAFVSGTAVNLIQQSQNLTFQKIDEGKAVYYMAGFGFSDDMKVRINLNVQPDPNKPAYTIKFEQTFYADK